MSRPVVIVPEMPIHDWFDESSEISPEDQIVNSIIDGLDEEDKETYFKTSLNDIPNPTSLKDIDYAVDLFVDAILNGKKILVVGDYDVDGITSTALLIRFFKRSGFGGYEAFIPNRFIHGYGLTEKTVEIVLSKKPDLVITVDNGTTAKNEVETIREKGINVIVTDHHLPQEDSMPDCAVLNPKQQGCGYPYKHLSGVGVVFLLLIAVRAKLRDIGFWLKKEKEPNLLEHLDLVALGTIADQVPLLGLNRLFAKYGLNQMTKKIHEGYGDDLFNYLKVFAKKTKINSFNSESIAFNLAPLLNATGRMKDAEEGLNFLLSDTDQIAMSRYQYLERLNQKRRKKQQIMAKKAMTQAEMLTREDKGIVIYDESFHEGLLGIIASHLVDRFHFPSVVLTDGENGVLKASSRSRNENIMEMLKECEDYLIQFGGHANAAGFSLKKENLAGFHECFTEVCARFIPRNKKYRIAANMEVKLEMMTFNLINRLKVLEPYGHLNRKPVFFIPHIDLPVPTTLTGKHLKWQLDHELELIYWNGAESLPHAQCYDVAFTLGENIFRGKRKRQMVVNSIVAAG
ncbi:MAG: single-stranded-DNA-specific exonuclease RecJ [Proteobacteria bacterium]|nr:single-stranded-DNA-specific exonuclease RecJ [Pseudomonadota bacterium]